MQRRYERFFPSGELLAGVHNFAFRSTCTAILDHHKKRKSMINDRKEVSRVELPDTSTSSIQPNNLPHVVVAAENSLTPSTIPENSCSATYTVNSCEIPVAGRDRIFTKYQDPVDRGVPSRFQP